MSQTILGTFAKWVFDATVLVQASWARSRAELLKIECSPISHMLPHQKSPHLKSLHLFDFAFPQLVYFVLL